MGPTASGKTRVAVALGQRLEVELVNADSRQAIAELAVGVCKPTASELCGVACHGLDWSHLGQPFSAAEYCELATTCVAQIAERGRAALLVGGTGLYIRSLLAGFDFGGVPPEAHRSRQGERDAESERGAAAALLGEHPEWPWRVDRNNPRRVIRAAELSRAGSVAARRTPPWSVTKLALRVSAEVLRARIEARSERLVGEPLRREVELLLSLGFPAEVLARSAIGYAETLAWLQGG
ncbi:MAG: tRNA (adenosine(37)-N6)-dimethylallyltransferase, partial [Streptosporangiaceae bacterium]